ncbi:hypothetical protein J2Z62_000403 [Mycoplasmoides fastidiosum]|uniref:Lipoprotein n=1 Tax=Mycoplasmoides fastidiosum TaxID=92758 RepID=A0ABU0LZ27_9BACT|nr:hypothetical protein [Mycoplasmoides fastidiosum]MDQ0513965.1 hypothetical protein [Mycoplasmoides fastidiosum]UUD37621.1 hypothetical protein NPA10_03575 [Mycoplasmoides fastidiosum]
MKKIRWFKKSKLWVVQLGLVNIGSLVLSACSEQLANTESINNNQLSSKETKDGRPLIKNPETTLTKPPVQSEDSKPKPDVDANSEIGKNQEQALYFFEKPFKDLSDNNKTQNQPNKNNIPLITTNAEQLDRIKQILAQSEVQTTLTNNKKKTIDEINSQFNLLNTKSVSLSSQTITNAQSSLGKSNDTANNSATASVHALTKFLQSSLVKIQSSDTSQEDQKFFNDSFNALTTQANQLSSELTKLSSSADQEKLLSLKADFSKVLKTYIDSNNNQVQNLRSLVEIKDQYLIHLRNLTEKYVKIANLLEDLSLKAIKLEDRANHLKSDIFQSKENQEALDHLLDQLQSQLLGRSSDNIDQNFNYSFENLVHQNQTWNQLDYEIKALTLNQGLLSNNQDALIFLALNSDKLLDQLNFAPNLNHSAQVAGVAPLLTQLNKNNTRNVARDIKNQTNKFQNLLTSSKWTSLTSNGWTSLIGDLQKIKQLETRDSNFLGSTISNLESMIQINKQFHDKFTNFYQEWNKFRAILTTLQSLKDHYQVFQIRNTKNLLQYFIDGSDLKEDWSKDFAEMEKILKDEQGEGEASSIKNFADMEKILKNIQTKISSTEKNTLTASLKQLIDSLSSSNEFRIFDQFLASFLKSENPSVNTDVGSDSNGSMQSASALFEKLKLETNNLITSSEKIIEALLKLFANQNSSSTKLSPSSSVNELAKLFNSDKKQPESTPK